MIGNVDLPDTVVYRRSMSGQSTLDAMASMVADEQSRALRNALAIVELIVTTSADPISLILTPAYRIDDSPLGPFITSGYHVFVRF